MGLTIIFSCDKFSNCGLTSNLFKPVATNLFRYFFCNACVEKICQIDQVGYSVV